MNIINLEYGTSLLVQTSLENNIGFVAKDTEVWGFGFVT